MKSFQKKSNMIHGPIFAQKPSECKKFWNNATKYTSLRNDECFVGEIAYMMVTLHRTGA